MTIYPACTAEYPISVICAGKCTPRVTTDAVDDMWAIEIIQKGLCVKPYLILGLKLILKENLFLSDLPLFIIVLAVLIVLLV